MFQQYITNTFFTFFCFGTVAYEFHFPMMLRHGNTHGIPTATKPELIAILLKDVQPFFSTNTHNFKQHVVARFNQSVASLGSWNWMFLCFYQTVVEGLSNNGRGDPDLRDPAGKLNVRGSAPALVRWGVDISCVDIVVPPLTFLRACTCSSYLTMLGVANKQKLTIDHEPNLFVHCMFVCFWWFFTTKHCVSSCTFGAYMVTILQNDNGNWT